MKKSFTAATFPLLGLKRGSLSSLLNKLPDLVTDHDTSCYAFAYAHLTMLALAFNCLCVVGRPSPAPIVQQITIQ